MLILDPLLRALIAPALAAAAVLAVLSFRGRREPGAGRAWAGGLAAALGYACAHVLIRGRPSFPVVDVQEWLLWLAAAGAAAGALEALGGRRRAARWPARAALSIALPWLLLRPRLAIAWSPAAGTGWIAGLAAALFVNWTLLASLARSRDGASLPALLAAVAAATAGVMLLTASAKLAMLAAALAVSLGCVALAAWRRPALALARGAVPVAALMLAGLWALGCFYSETPAASVLLLAAAAHAGWVVEIGRARGLRPVTASLLGAGASIFLLAAAIANAAWG